MSLGSWAPSSQSWTEPKLPAVETQNPNRCTTREFLKTIFDYLCSWKWYGITLSFPFASIREKTHVHKSTIHVFFPSCGLLLHVLIPVLIGGIMFLLINCLISSYSKSINIYHLLQYHQVCWFHCNFVEKNCLLFFFKKRKFKALCITSIYLFSIVSSLISECLLPI